MSKHAPARSLQTPASTKAAGSGALLQRQAAEARSPGGLLGTDEAGARHSPSAAGAPSAVPPLVHDVLRAPGQSLDARTRAWVEPRFGHDFSGVRVHTDSRAAASARSVQALAYTVGQDVVFAAGQYRPETPGGRRLLAHELTHVVHQRPASPDAPLILGGENDRCEQEARRAETAVTEDSSASFGVAEASAGRVLRRFSESEHQRIGEAAYNQAFSEMQSASGTAEQPVVDEAFVNNLRNFRFRTASARTLTYGQLIAAADNVASFEVLEERERRRAGAGVRIPVLSFIWDEIEDATHYIDLAARNRRHFHPHNFQTWQPWHRSALQTMHEAWQASERANGMRRQRQSLLQHFDQEEQRARRAVLERESLATDDRGPRAAELDRIIELAVPRLQRLVAQVRQLQEEYPRVRNQANNLALRAMAVNGFADHFLTDAFSAGHIVTPRRELLDEYSTRLLGFIPVGGVLHCANIPSLAWHDLDNIFGVEVNNANGARWLTYGDDYLDRDAMPTGRSRSPTMEHVVNATAASIGQMWQAAAGRRPTDLLPVLNHLPRPELDHYPRWQPADWDRQLRFAAGEAVGTDYSLPGDGPSSRPPPEQVPNPRGHQVGASVLSARATCLNLMSEFSYTRFVVPMIERARRDYNERYFHGQIVPPDTRPAVQESVRGHVIAGSLIGAGLGAGLGYLLGGGLGAVLGGIVGLVAGGFVGGLLGPRRDQDNPRS